MMAQHGTGQGEFKSVSCFSSAHRVVVVLACLAMLDVLFACMLDLFD